MKDMKNCAGCEHMDDVSVCLLCVNGDLKKGAEEDAE
jgi:hypothetical protein